jgi:Arc/MetJ family transcription regulator
MKTGVARVLSMTPSAIRKRKSRQREADGLKRLGIDIDAEAVAEAIRIRDALNEAAPISDAKMRHELSELVAIWAERWIRTGHA